MPHSGHRKFLLYAMSNIHENVYPCQFPSVAALIFHLCSIAYMQQELHNDNPENSEVVNSPPVAIPRLPLPPTGTKWQGPFITACSFNVISLSVFLPVYSLKHFGLHLGMKFALPCLALPCLA